MRVYHYVLISNSFCIGKQHNNSTDTDHNQKHYCDSDNNKEIVEVLNSGERMSYGVQCIHVKTGREYQFQVKAKLKDQSIWHK